MKKSNLAKALELTEETPIPRNARPVRAERLESYFGKDKAALIYAAIKEHAEEISTKTPNNYWNIVDLLVEKTIRIDSMSKLGVAASKAGESLREAFIALQKLQRIPEKKPSPIYFPKT